MALHREYYVSSWDDLVSPGAGMGGLPLLFLLALGLEGEIDVGDVGRDWRRRA